MDADDEWLPDKLTNCWHHISRGKTTFLPTTVGFRTPGQTYIDIAARFHDSDGQVFAGLYKRGFISTSSVSPNVDIIEVEG